MIPLALHQIILTSRDCRLDRLVTLLETGSTQLIRNTAAQQLADVQKSHPDELFNLLTRVVPYLRSPSWDTRTAAAKAIGGIVDHAEKYDPNATLEEIKKDEPNGDDHVSAVKKEDPDLPSTSNPDQLSLATLDVESILTYGKELLGSAGQGAGPGRLLSRTDLVTNAAAGAIRRLFSFSLAARRGGDHFRYPALLI